MSDLRKQYRDYIANIHLMQLATADPETGRPWLCSVWYVMDADDTVYWCSRKTRRHSQEITKSGYATCTMIENYQEGLGQKGRSLVLSGRSNLVPREKISKVYALYSKKYKNTPDFFQDLESFLQGDSQQAFYQIIPDQIIWWDEIEPGDNPRKVIK